MVATFIYDDNLYCFNVGDSRALLVSKVANEWKLKPLSDDQKPSREDEKQRIIKAGGSWFVMKAALRRRLMKVAIPLVL